MIKKIKIAFAFAIVFPAFCMGQFYEDAIYDHLDHLRRENNITDFNPKAYENIKGSPFLATDFEKGNVVLKSGEKYRGEFRYDVYADQMQFMANDKIYVVAFPEKLELLQIEENIFRFVPFFIDRKVKSGYFVSLSQGYYSLYLRKGKTLKDPVASKPYEQARPAKFLDRKDFFYFQVGENAAIRVNNKKDLINLCGDKGSEVEKYMKSNKINVKNRADLTELTTYINKTLVD